MKLSELEKLVSAMRAMADDNNTDDPNVQFWIADPACDTRDYLKDHAFHNVEPEADACDTLKDHVVGMSGNGAKRGDFAIPVRLVW